MYGKLRGSVGVPEEKIPLEKPRCGWEVNFKTQIPSKKFGAWTDLTRDRKGCLPFSTRNFGVP
jgi:hypothetical protein